MSDAPQTYEEALAIVRRREAALANAGPRLPKHQRAELIAHLMEACEWFDEIEAAAEAKAA